MTKLMEVPMTISSRTSALLNAGNVRSGDVIETEDIFVSTGSLT